MALNISQRIKPKHFPWIKSVLLTSLFCVLIAFTTQTVWEGGIANHLLISFGFGYSAILSSFVIVRLFPNISKLLEAATSMVFSLIVGTLNARFWLDEYLDDSQSGMKSVVLLGIVFCTICYYYFYTKEQKLVAENALETAKRRQADQDKALVQSQLKQLQSQIEPHFLFNTLATISALIETDNDKAKLMLEKLTELLRVTLKNSRNEQSTIEQELALINAYLGIQKIRLGERLTFSINSEGISDDQILPPFLIQPLVENALTHGIEPRAVGGNVSIQITRKDSHLVIEVSDNGAGLNPEPSSSTTGHGVGLSNIKQRIETLFEGKASMSIKEQSTGGVISTLSLPI